MNSPAVRFWFSFGKDNTDRRRGLCARSITQGDVEVATTFTTEQGEGFGVRSSEFVWNPVSQILWQEIRRFEEILAWQKARELVRETYRVCGIAPFTEQEFRIKGSDMSSRRVGSAMANVAEGFGRKSFEKLQHDFLDVARGSTLEVQSLLYFAVI